MQGDGWSCQRIGQRLAPPAPSEYVSASRTSAAAQASEAFAFAASLAATLDTHALKRNTAGSASSICPRAASLPGRQCASGPAPTRHWASPTDRSSSGGRFSRQIARGDLSTLAGVSNSMPAHAKLPEASVEQRRDSAIDPDSAPPPLPMLRHDMGLISRQQLVIGRDRNFATSSRSTSRGDLSPWGVLSVTPSSTSSLPRDPVATCAMRNSDSEPYFACGEHAPTCESASLSPALRSPHCQMLLPSHCALPHSEIQRQKSSAECFSLRTAPSLPQSQPELKGRLAAMADQCNVQMPHRSGAIPHDGSLALPGWARGSSGCAHGVELLEEQLPRKGGKPTAGDLLRAQLQGLQAQEAREDEPERERHAKTARQLVELGRGYEQLQGDLTAFRDEYKTAQQQHGEAMAQNRRLEAELHRLQHTCAELQARCPMLENELLQSHDERAMLQDEVLRLGGNALRPPSGSERVTAEADVLLEAGQRTEIARSRENSSAAKQHAQSQSAQNQVAQTCNGAEDKFAAYEERLRAYELLSAASAERLQALQQRVPDLEARLQEARSECRELASENMQLRLRAIDGPPKTLATKCLRRAVATGPTVRGDQPSLQQTSEPSRQMEALQQRVSDLDVPLQQTGSECNGFASENNRFQASDLQRNPEGKSWHRSSQDLLRSEASEHEARSRLRCHGAQLRRLPDASPDGCDPAALPHSEVGEVKTSTPRPDAGGHLMKRQIGKDSDLPTSAPVPDPLRLEGRLADSRTGHFSEELRPSMGAPLHARREAGAEFIIVDLTQGGSPVIHASDEQHCLDISV